MEPEFRVVLQPNDAARPDKHFRAYADAEQFANAEVNSGRADRASIYKHGANNRLVRVITPKVSEEEIARINDCERRRDPGRYLRKLLRL